MQECVEDARGQEQGMSSALAVSIKGSDSCSESHHLMCKEIHDQDVS